MGRLKYLDYKRSQRQTIKEILYRLNQSKDGLVITKLMHKANMPHKILMNYLNQFIELGVVKKEKIKKKRYKYALTEKGKELFYHYIKTEDVERRFGLNEQQR